MLHHPPNTHEFDAVSAHSIVSKSPLLQARINVMSKERGQQVPVINVVLPNSNNIGGHLNNPAAAPRAPENSEGPKMDIQTFCSMYSLSDGLLHRFQEH